MPGRVRAGMTMQQHHRFPAAAVPHPERHLADIDPVQLETLKHEPQLPMRCSANQGAAGSGTARRTSSARAVNSARHVAGKPLDLSHVSCRRCVAHPLSDHRLGTARHGLQNFG